MGEVEIYFVYAESVLYFNFSPIPLYIRRPHRKYNSVLCVMGPSSPSNNGMVNKKRRWWRRE